MLTLPLPEDVYLSVRITGPIHPDTSAQIIVHATDNRVSNDVFASISATGTSAQGLMVWVAQMVGAFLLREELYQFQSWLNSFHGSIELRSVSQPTRRAVTGVRDSR